MCAGAGWTRLRAQQAKALSSVARAVAACLAFSALTGGRHLQQADSTPCPEVRELTVEEGSSSGPGVLNVSLALAEAGQCAADNDTASAVVHVDWAGSVETTEPFVVPAGVVLRVDGRRPWYSAYLESQETGGGFELDDELESAIADAAVAAAVADPEGADGPSSAISSVNGTAGLFVVRPGGSLHLSDLVMSGASGGDVGGGAVRAEGGQVEAEGIRWASLNAEGAGGAVFAQDEASVNLSGLHVFQGCSSSGHGGGAVYAKNASWSFHDGARVYFESCSAATSGGGVQLFSSTLNASDGSRTRFRECSAGDKGGALYTKGSTVVVGDGASLEFRACASGDEDGAKGGGICSYESIFSAGDGAEVAFINNSSPVGDGGGLYGQGTTLQVRGDGSTLLFQDNLSGNSGGGLALEWPSDDNISDCLFLAEGSNATFSGNSAVEYGGGAYVDGCVVALSGSVSFRGNAAERAGALYIVESAVSVPGDALFVGNSADRWGGAVYLLDSRETAGAGLRLTGDVEFRGNAAGRSGGGVYIENGDLTVVRGGEEEGLGGALWTGNTAGYDGGVVAVDGGGVRIEGGLASSNQAAQRGGVLFGTGDSTLSWGAGGETWNNLAAAGGVMYVSSSVVNLTDLRLVGDRAPTGSNVFLASADVRAVNVTMIAPAIPGGTFALYVDSGSAFRGFACSLDQWDVEAHAVISEGTLVLDAWDFRGSRSPSLVHASGSGTTIRNAVLGDNNFESVGFNATSSLGEGVNDCASLPAELSCAVAEDCADAGNGMGVLCPAFTEATTFRAVSLGGEASGGSGSGSGSGGSASLVELGVVADAATGGASSSSENRAVYYPGIVIEELALRHTPESSQEEGGGDDDDDDYNDEGMAAILAGAGGVLWELRRTDGVDGDGDGDDALDGIAPDKNGAFAVARASPDNFTWTAVPSSGFLVEGQEVTIRLVGTPPPPPDPSYPFAVYNGEVTARFRVVYRTAESGSMASSGGSAAVASTFYYCRQGSYWDGGDCVSCAEQMAEMSAGEDALDCSMPGVTLDTLPLAEGYWRGDITRTFVRECLNPSACVGGRGTDTSPYLASSGTSSEATSSVSVTTAATIAASSVEYDERRYCVEGHRGAFCAVCADGYRRLSAGQVCVSCEGGWSGGARLALWILAAAAPLALVALVVFLVGGAPTVVQLKDKVVGCCFCRRRPNALSAAARGFGPSESAQRRSASRRTVVSSFGARLLRAIPFQKLKILIVVWQILTQFSHLAEIPYPPNYRRFLNLLEVFSFDISWPLNATCLVGNISFYQRLVGVTLAPLVVLAFLCTTYAMAMTVHRSRPGRSGSAEARQRAVVRHASAALLLLFLVFSSVSTTVFSTYACDYVEDLEVSLLRADYSISCDHPDHVFYEWYAALMIMLYPIGIPALFAVLLLNRKDKINPPVLHLPADGKGKGSPALALTTSTDTVLESSGRSDGDGEDDAEAAGAGAVVVPASAARSGGVKPTGGSGGGGRGGVRSRGAAVRDGGGAAAGADLRRHRDHGRFSGEGKRRLLRSNSSGGGGGGGGGSSNCFVTDLGGRAAVDREEALESRAHDPDLQSTRFLWEPYEPDDYYYETVECGRRCLLTGALVFVLPNTAGQAAGACVFAFLSLLAFELLRPHLSHTDGWMYRMGCIVVFFSNFLALMAKADVSDEEAQSQETFGLLLIAVHAAMVIAVIIQAYLSMQATSESRDDALESFLKKNPTQANGGGRNDTDAPRHAAGGGGGGGGGPGRLGAGAGAEVKVEVGGEQADGRPVMWKHDGFGREGGDDGGGGLGGDYGDGYGDDGVGPIGAAGGWEDVEWSRWGRGNHARVAPSVYSIDREDHIEDSVELESVYSQRTKKTSLVAGTLGLGLPHRRHHAPVEDLGDVYPSISGRSTATAGSVLTASPDGRVDSANGSSGTRERKAAKGHVLRRSTGGWGVGGVGLDHRHKAAGSSLSSSLSPVRHVRRGSADGGTVGRMADARLCAIGQRGASGRQLMRFDMSGDRARRGSAGDAIGEGEADTTASKLERLHRLSSQRRGGGGGGGGTRDAFPPQPKLLLEPPAPARTSAAVSISEGVAEVPMKRSSKKGGRQSTKVRAPASGDALSSAPAGRGVERGGSDFVVSEGTFV